MKLIREEDKQRFFKFVLKTDDGHWIWTSALKGRYPSFWLEGKPRPAHRLSYETFVGEIPFNKEVLHNPSCNKPRCVNPEHLYLGTQKENVRDALASGNWNTAKITQEVADKIRQLRNEGKKQHEIASMFGLSQPNVSRICSGHQWRLL